MCLPEANLRIHYVRDDKWAHEHLLFVPRREDEVFAAIRSMEKRLLLHAPWPPARGDAQHLRTGMTEIVHSPDGRVRVVSRQEPTLCVWVDPDTLEVTRAAVEEAVQ